MEIIYKLLVVAVALLGFYVGARRGILRQLMSVLGVAFAIVSCRVLTPSLSIWLYNQTDRWHAVFGPDVVYSVLASAMIFVTVYSVFAVCSFLLNKITMHFEIGGIDLLLGAIYRTFRNLLFISLTYNVIAVLNADSPLWEAQRGADGNLIEIAMPIAPGLLDNHFEQLEYRRQMDEARKISMCVEKPTGTQTC